MNVFIVDYVFECVEVGDWEEVIFDNVFDMVIGWYWFNEREVDENKMMLYVFFLVFKYSKKIEIVCIEFF